MKIIEKSTNNANVSHTQIQTHILKSNADLRLHPLISPARIERTQYSAVNNTNTVQSMSDDTVIQLRHSK